MPCYICDTLPLMSVHEQIAAFLLLGNVALVTHLYIIHCNYIATSTVDVILMKTTQKRM